MIAINVWVKNPERFPLRAVFEGANPPSSGLLKIPGFAIGCSHTHSREKGNAGMSGRKNLGQMELFVTGSPEKLIPDVHKSARENRVLDPSRLRVAQVNLGVQGLLKKSREAILSCAHAFEFHSPLEGRPYLLGKADNEARAKPAGELVGGHATGKAPPTESAFAQTARPLRLASPRKPDPQGVVEKPLLVRNWSASSFRRMPESRAGENGDAPVFHPSLTGGIRKEPKNKGKVPGFRHAPE